MNTARLSHPLAISEKSKYSIRNNNFVLIMVIVILFFVFQFQILSDKAHAEDLDADVKEGFQLLSPFFFGPPEDPWNEYRLDQTEYDSKSMMLPFPQEPPPVRPKILERIDTIRFNDGHLLSIHRSDFRYKENEFSGLCVLDKDGKVLLDIETIYKSLFASEVKDIIKAAQRPETLRLISQLPDLLNKIKALHMIAVGFDLGLDITSKVMAAKLTGGLSLKAHIVSFLGTDGLEKTSKALIWIELDHWSNLIGEAVKLLFSKDADLFTYEERCSTYYVLNHLEERGKALIDLVEESFPGAGENVFVYTFKKIGRDLAAGFLHHEAARLAHLSLDGRYKYENAIRFMKLGANFSTGDMGLKIWSIMSGVVESVVPLANYQYNISLIDKYVSEAFVLRHAMYLKEIWSKPGERKTKLAKMKKGVSIFFLLDTSGSMRDHISGGEERKIDSAVKAIRLLVDNTKRKDNVEWGILSFTGKCGIQISVPFTGEAQVIYNFIDTVQAKSGTPLAKGIIAAEEYCRSSAHYEEVHILLLSDGMEQCAYSVESGHRFRWNSAT